MGVEEIYCRCAGEHRHRHMEWSRLNMVSRLSQSWDGASERGREEVRGKESTWEPREQESKGDT